MISMGLNQKTIQALTRAAQGVFRDSSAEIILSACGAKITDNVHDESRKKDEIAAAVFERAFGLYFQRTRRIPGIHVAAAS
jgi:hypothetical protein